MFIFTMPDLSPGFSISSKDNVWPLLRLVYPQLSGETFRGDSELKLEGSH